MLSCKQLVAHSSDFMDGQLLLHQRLSVRTHLALCRDCRRFIRQLRLSGVVVGRLAPKQNAQLDALAAMLAEIRRNAD
ncbi:MAG: zf-HC2 domain-containing protein [Pseudomonas sp.]